MSQNSKLHRNVLTSLAIRPLSPVAISGISAALILVCYGAAKLFLGTDRSPAGVIGGLAFVLGAVAVLIRKGRRTDAGSRKDNILISTGIIAITTTTLYAISLSTYVGTGRLLGTVIGALAGALVFAGESQRSRLVDSRYVSKVVWGVLVFVLMRESMLDVLSMGSRSLEPRIQKNEKIIVSYASCGVRVPFTPHYIILFGGECRRLVILS